MRIKFPLGKQREFIKYILQETGSPSLRGLTQLGISTPYSTLKNYYTEQRLIPQELYEDLCELANLDKTQFGKETLPLTWGQTKGGRKSKRKKTKTIKALGKQ